MLARRASRLSSIEATKGMILAMKKNIWRAAIEVGFIIFLFYSNLLMGDLSVQVWEGGGRSVGNRRCFHYCKFRNCRESRSLAMSFSNFFGRDSRQSSL